MLVDVASCDSQGSVYIGERHVYRIIDPISRRHVLRILSLVDGRFNGLIDTIICDEGSIPPELAKHSPSLILRHKKIPFISYPNEWCAEMLHDAAIFHLQLSQELLKIGVYLKDAHPWNILFDKGSPYFVDFTSLVEIDELLKENYLEANKAYEGSSIKKRTAEIIAEIHSRLFEPYFLNPLLFYQFGDRGSVRYRIKESTLNVNPRIITIKDCIPTGGTLGSRISGKLSLLKIASYTKKALRALRVDLDINKYFKAMDKIVSSLLVRCGGSSYSTYYRNKGEAVDWRYSENWNKKQKAVHNALDSYAIDTVLDVACNTGWYSLMAEKLGKKVVAFDIDEACIEELYIQVKENKLDILPLVMNFTKLTEDQFSMHDGKKVLMNAFSRLRADCVMALGILHHLVLGAGMSFKEAFEPLIKLTKKQLLIEFIDSNDDVIKNEPEFFPAYFNDKRILAMYSIEAAIEILKESGFAVSVLDSHPSTRKILICNIKES